MRPSYRGPELAPPLGHRPPGHPRVGHRLPGRHPPGHPRVGRRPLLVLLLILAVLSTVAPALAVPQTALAPAAMLPAQAGPATTDPAGTDPVASDATTPRSGYDWPVTGDSGEGDVLRAFDPPPLPWLPGHRGVDLAAETGAPVRAAGAGTVAFAGMVAGRPVVSIQHPDGLRTTYEPVTPTVQAGDAVDQGAVIGRLSDAGSHCEPSCLHWGVRTGTDAYLDPLLLVGAEVVIRLYPPVHG